MVINTPEAPASKKQLWLLHLLTKKDTREWNLTMQQANDKISELKQGNGNNKRPLINPHASAIKQDQQKLAQSRYDKQFGHLTGYGMNIGNLRIVQAYKEVSMHHDTETKKPRICVSLKASGIFPGGKKQHIITEFIKTDTDVSLTPLFAYIRHNVTVPLNDYKAWIKSLPVKLNNSKYNPIPESWHDKAIELAKDVDCSIAILDVD